jgi:hypothetical protein
MGGVYAREAKRPHACLTTAFLFHVLLDWCAPLALLEQLLLDDLSGFLREK